MPSSEAAPPPGTFSVMWSIVDQLNRPIDCAQAGAKTVVISIKDSTSGEVFGASFPCPLGSAVSGSLAPSTYDLTFSATGDTGTVATAAPQTGVTIQSKMTTKLQPVVLVKM